ncbi:uncharacterized protein LOC132705286 isoform X2 [Cylas formicarius]|uniref:uncharacterized protein LOC132705286 isoform X2 n=1 Tax=Cylas formicarius TaxID=197179 RepID=UPI0029585FEF|nr:uncharacterized protein LOC132705286 isoform X2 [Cylas formicarius]
MVTMARRLIVFYLCLALDGTFSHAETTNPVDKLADKLLNTDQRYGLANLISAVYANIKSAPHESASGRFGILSAFFRILGLDGKKIGAIAVNVLILIAESISASLSTKSSAELPQSRKQTVTGSPFQWMNENAVVAEMASHMTDASLPNEVVKHIKERSLDEATGCIQLLMCKDYCSEEL